MLPLVTLEGRVVADPELRYSPSGMAVAKFRMVCSKQKFNEETKKWEDDRVLWMPVTVFKKVAENVVESIQKGDLVTVVGRLQTDEWTTDANEKRSQVACVADSVAVSLQFRVVPHSAGRAERATAPAAEDPWATPTGGDEPPF